MNKSSVHPAASSGVFLPPMDGNAPGNQLPHQVTVVVLIVYYIIYIYNIMIMVDFNDDDYDGSGNKLPHQVAFEDDCHGGFH